MTLRARVWLSLVIVLLVGAGEWCYLGWPRWFGIEMRVPVRIGSRAGSRADPAPFYPEFSLQIQAANTTSVPGRSPVEATVVPWLGDVWDEHVPAQTAAARLHGRTAYLQMSGASGQDPLWRVKSISLAPVPGASNLRVHINAASSSGHIAVDIYQGVPSAADIAEGHAALLRVLPSGRAALVAIQ